MLIESREIKAMLKSLIKTREETQMKTKALDEQFHHEIVCEAYENVLAQIERMEEAHQEGLK